MTEVITLSLWEPTSSLPAILLSCHLNKEVPCYKHTVIIELDKYLV